MAGRSIVGVIVGKHVIELPGAYVHFDDGVKTSTMSEDGFIEILDDRPVALRYEDGDFWFELITPSMDAVEEAMNGLKDAGCYLDIQLVPALEKAPECKRWATSDEETGEIEFMSDDEIMEQWADHCAYNAEQREASMETSEVLAIIAEAFKDEGDSNILEPEGCIEIFVGNRHYHIIVEKVEDA